MENRSAGSADDCHVNPRDDEADAVISAGAEPSALEVVRHLPAQRDDGRHHSGVPLSKTNLNRSKLIARRGRSPMLKYLRTGLVLGAAFAILLVLPGNRSMAAEQPSPLTDTNQPRQYDEFKPLSGLDNTPKGGTLPGGTLPGGTVPGGTLPGGTLPGGTLPGGTLPGGTLPGGTLPGGSLPGGTVPGGTLPGGTLAGGPL